jgi:hypothetical protein
MNSIVTSPSSPSFGGNQAPLVREEAVVLREHPPRDAAGQAEPSHGDSSEVHSQKKSIVAGFPAFELPSSLRPQRVVAVAAALQLHKHAQKPTPSHSIKSAPPFFLTIMM